MPKSGTPVIALHIEAAKKLLRELDTQAEAAMAMLGQDHSEFLAVVDRRGRLLEEFGRLVGIITAAQRQPGATPVNSGAIKELARAAATAVQSHRALLASAQEERDRLTHVGDRIGRPDAVARQYGVSSVGSRHLISVSG